MSNPTVSIIMNCLNAEDYLAEALESVRKQSFQDFEIIFLDNGSTDGSAAIARKYGGQLRYFHNSSTVPLGEARNQAISQARGDFIAFLDCDDIWLPRKLEKQLDAFQQNSGTGLVCTDTEIFRGGKSLSRIFENSPPARGKAFAELMQRQWISMSSAVISKKALDSVATSSKRNGEGEWFDERLNVCEEADLFYRIAHDWELDYVPEALTRWRVHGDNTTFSKFSQFSRETRLILEKHKEIYPEYEKKYGNLVALLEQRAAFQHALALWRDKQNRKAREEIAPYRRNSLKFRLFHLATFLPGNLFDVLSALYFSLPGRLRR